MTSKNKLLSIDLSTTCTGYAVYSIEDKKLLEYQEVKPKLTKEEKKELYPIIQIIKIRSMVNQILEVIDRIQPEIIVLEEINRGISRLGQKTLDGAHFVLIHCLKDNDLRKVIYVNSDGSDGWRSRGTGLGLQLSDVDKLHNKTMRKTNKTLKVSQTKSIINQKTLAIKMANKLFNLGLQEDSQKGNDIADAVLLGWFYLTKRLK